jgi:hypothetical protein
MAEPVSMVKNATSDFAIPWLTESTDAERSWMRSTYSRMRGYPPFQDAALSWGPPTDFYKDLYAIYRDDADDRALMNEHPDWVLRDESGRDLYIPYGCSGGTCPAYAADIGDPGWRAHWIAQARSELDKGYAGIFIDNVNMDVMVGNGQGESVRPMDPRTGAPMTTADWRRYVAEFTEQIRAAFPGVAITHNAGQWWVSEDDPFYQREVAAADTVELERGFHDHGIGRGRGTFGYRTFVGHIQWLHDQGSAVVLEPYLSNRRQALYEVSNYLLVRESGDAIASDWRSDPDNWWPGWSADLGAPEGPAYWWRRQGLWRRDYANGSAVVNPPGRRRRSFAFQRARTKAGDRRTFAFPRARTKAGGRSNRRFTLAGKQGGIFLKR